MNPVVTLDLARLDTEERLRDAQAWRAARGAHDSAGGGRRRLRVRLGVALQHLGSRVAGATSPSEGPSRRAPVRVP